jgi:hypothetical protein
MRTRCVSGWFSHRIPGGANLEHLCALNSVESHSTALNGTRITWGFSVSAGDSPLWTRLAVWGSGVRAPSAPLLINRPSCLVSTGRSSSSRSCGDHWLIIWVAIGIDSGSSGGGFWRMARHPGLMLEFCGRGWSRPLGHCRSAPQGPSDHWTGGVGVRGMVRPRRVRCRMVSFSEWRSAARCWW